MNLKVECPERYLDDVTGVTWRNPDDVTMGQKIGKLTWPRLETRLRGIYTRLRGIYTRLRGIYATANDICDS